MNGFVTRRLWCCRGLLLSKSQQICSSLSTAPASFGLAAFRPQFSLHSQFQHRTLIHYNLLHLQNGFTLTGCSLRPPLSLLQTRGIVNHRWVNYSKPRGKKKSVKAVSKRFHRTGSGKLKYWPAGKVHNMLSKSRNHRQSLRKPRYATKKQLKTLNKMIAGW